MAPRNRNPKAFSGLVREFYANAGDGLQTDTTIVRGVEVSFSTADINAYYGLEDHRTIDYYHRELRLSRLTGDRLNEIARSFHPEAIWNIAHGLPAHIDYHYFRQRDGALLDFIKAKLTPFSHKGNVHRDKVLLAYCIKKRRTINMGAIINRSICEIASSDKKSRYPAPAPEQFDMQEFIRSGNEVHWFVGTSMYQHSREAQGLPPHFPPPPPWFQDPQYVPDFYSQHYPPPPPPDDADHQ
nr:uncharacterized protein LOC109169324 [Ipomoea batatas]